jgi:8-oxo-dGTP diphosphatase
MGTVSPAQPMLTVDVVVLTDAPVPGLLLVQRAHPPFAGEWALPGGFVEEGERSAEAAPRELAEETGLEVGSLRLLGVYDTPGRDPRGWTVSIAYLATVQAELAVRARRALVSSRHPAEARLRPRGDYWRRAGATSRAC